MAEEKIGTVIHFFDKISVAIIKLESGSLKVGDKIKLQGKATNFEQTVDSIQVEHKSIEEAKAGDEVGIKVADKVHEKDSVLKITE